MRAFARGKLTVVVALGWLLFLAFGIYQAASSAALVLRDAVVIGTVHDVRFLPLRGRCQVRVEIAEWVSLGGSFALDEIPRAGSSYRLLGGREACRTLSSTSDPEAGKEAPSNLLRIGWTWQQQALLLPFADEVRVSRDRWRDANEASY